MSTNSWLSLVEKRRKNRHALIDTRRGVNVSPLYARRPCDRLLQLRRSIVLSQLFAERFVSGVGGLRYLSNALISTDPLCRVEAVYCYANLLAWRVVDDVSWRSIACYIVSYTTGYCRELRLASLACLANAAVCGVEYCRVLTCLLAPRCILDCLAVLGDDDMLDWSAHALALFLFHSPVEIVTFVPLDQIYQSLLVSIRNNNIGHSHWFSMWALARLANSLSQQTIELMTSLMLRHMMSVLFCDVSVRSLSYIRSFTCQLRALTALTCTDFGIRVLCEHSDLYRLLYVLFWCQIRHIQLETLPLVANILFSSVESARCVKSRIKSDHTFERWLLETAVAAFPFGV